MAVAVAVEGGQRVEEAGQPANEQAKVLTENRSPPTPLAACEQWLSSEKACLAGWRHFHRKSSFLDFVLVRLFVVLFVGLPVGRSVGRSVGLGDQRFVRGFESEPNGEVRN